MSWHFSQALVAAYSAANSSAGAPSAPSSGSPIPQAYLSPDRMKAFSRLSQFGMMCGPLTDDLGAGVLTWCLAASRAKTSAQPEEAQASTASEVECGRTWHESFARWDRATCSWKTPQCSLLEGLDEFSETWPRWGMMRGGECSAQTMLVLRTNETASGLWQTPVADDACSAMAANITPESAHAPNRFPNLETVVGRRMWPTPTAHNAKETNAPSESLRNTPTLAAQAGGSLNPTWVEWLMGWPLGWTDLKPLETDKFPQWQHSHGGF
jgi:hypothetical protein